MLKVTIINQNRPTLLTLKLKRYIIVSVEVSAGGRLGYYAKYIREQ